MHAPMHTSKPLQVQYDVMDADAPQYAADHGALRATISELEHRLGALIMQVRVLRGCLLPPMQQPAHACAASLWWMS